MRIILGESFPSLRVISRNVRVFPKKVQDNLRKVRVFLLKPPIFRVFKRIRGGEPLIKGGNTRQSRGYLQSVTLQKSRFFVIVVQKPRNPSQSFWRLKRVLCYSSVLFILQNSMFENFPPIFFVESLGSLENLPYFCIAIGTQGSLAKPQCAQVKRCLKIGCLTAANELHEVIETIT